MRRYYPYLQGQYETNLNTVSEKREFLKKLDSFINQRLYVRITLLDWSEDPIREIQGELSSGSMTKSGSSSVRMTCNFTVALDSGTYDSEDIKMDFSINKKVFLECGVKNETDEYADYPILWFPQGVFFISSMQISSTASGALNMSLSLKDKMCMLNGDVGGKLPATTIFDEEDTQSASGEYVSEKVLVYYIIQEAVHHFGGEDLNNIIIEDVDLKIRRVVKWMGTNPIYLVSNGNSTSNGYYIVRTTAPTDGSAYLKKLQGDDIGYVYDDFVYLSELTLSLGNCVTDLLDKIKSYLGGNYEYFYDEYGAFHFREIKNYVNTTFATTVLNTMTRKGQSDIVLGSMTKDDYMVENSVGESVYTFSDNSNIITMSCTPNYSNIKNDYVVQGLRKMTSSDVSYPVRYHLAIDSKPEKTEWHNSDRAFHYRTRSDFLLYKETKTGTVKGIFPTSYGGNLPEVGDLNLIYGNADRSKFWYWSGTAYKEVEVVEYFKSYEPQDWRTELYVRGLEGRVNGTDQGYYFAELESAWPLIYNLQTQRFYGEEGDKELYASSLTDGDYYLDFIDPTTTALGEYSVSAIGRRSDVVSDDDNINCLFAPAIPEVVYINSDDDDATEQRIEIEELGYPWSQVKSDIYSSFATGGTKSGAFDQIKYELYLHTNYQRSLSISARPVFYLSPNVRVTVSDNTTGVHGDFMVNSMTYTLGSNPSMTVSASEAFERF